jgi:hypothetical protein
MPKTKRAAAVDRGGAMAPVPFAWFTERNYPGVLALCREGCLLPADWAEWRREADALEQAARARGSRVNWVEVAPGDLRHWAERRRWQFIDTARLNAYVRQMAGHRTPESVEETPAGEDSGKRASAVREAATAPAEAEARTRGAPRKPKRTTKTPARRTAKAPARGTKTPARTPAGGTAKTPAGGTAKTPARGTAKTPARGTAKTPAQN